MSNADGSEEFESAICQRDGCDMSAEWHKDRTLCEFHAGAEWLRENREVR